MGTIKQLWAPWRNLYLRKGLKEQACFLCRIASDDPKRDPENLVLLRGKCVFAVLNLYPYNNGHLMIVPYRHIAEPGQLSEQERLEWMRFLELSLDALRKALRPHGFNVGCNLGRAAGAGLEDHLHLHVVPRWVGDTNFLPIFGETKVISQALQETYEELRAAFQSLL